MPLLPFFVLVQLFRQRMARRASTQVRLPRITQGPPQGHGGSRRDTQRGPMPTKPDVGYPSSLSGLPLGISRGCKQGVEKKRFHSRALWSQGEWGSKRVQVTLVEQWTGGGWGIGHMSRAPLGKPSHTRGGAGFRRVQNREEKNVHTLFCAQFLPRF